MKWRNTLPAAIGVVPMLGTAFLVLPDSAFAEYQAGEPARISLPRGQQPAQRLLIFQKGESYFHLGIQYETQQQLGMFDEIVSSFQFTP